MEVYYFKLYSGEDLLAELIEEDEECVYITMPFKFIYSNLPSQDHSESSLVSSIVQWFPSNKAMSKVIQLLKDDIVFGSEVETNLQKYYSYLVSEKRAASGLSDSESENDREKDIKDVMLMCARSPSGSIH